MALKDHWKPRIDGVDNADSTAVNEIAEEVIGTQNKVESLENKQTSTEESQASLSARVDEISATQSNLGNEVKNLDTKIKDFNSLVANALKGKASGENIALTDVSPIEHEMKVSASSKNLIKFPYSDGGAGFVKTINGITFTVSGDGTVTANGTATEQAYFVLNKRILSVGTYFLSGTPKNDSNCIIYIANTNYSLYKADMGNGIAATTTKEETCSIAISLPKGATVSNMIFKPQLELGTLATSYAPYVDVSKAKLIKQGTETVQYPISADGTVKGVKSTYPTTTLTSDTENVIIEAEYNRDINKAFEELTQAIISLGGNF